MIKSLKLVRNLNRETKVVLYLIKNGSLCCKTKILLKMYNYKSSYFS